MIVRYNNNTFPCVSMLQARLCSRCLKYLQITKYNTCLYSQHHVIIAAVLNKINSANVWKYLAHLFTQKTSRDEQNIHSQVRNNNWKSFLLLRIVCHKSQLMLEIDLNVFFFFHNESQYASYLPLDEFFFSCEDNAKSDRKYYNN